MAEQAVECSQPGGLLERVIYRISPEPGVLGLLAAGGAGGGTG